MIDKGGAFSFLIPADVRAVVASLDSEPEAWTPYYIGNDLYRLTHPSGLHLWTQNRAYGLEIYAPSGLSIWGGVSALSSIGLSIGRWALLFAIKRWEAKNPHNHKPLPTAAELLRRAA